MSEQLIPEHANSLVGHSPVPSLNPQQALDGGMSLAQVAGVDPQALQTATAVADGVEALQQGDALQGVSAVNGLAQAAGVDPRALQAASVFSDIAQGGLPQNVPVARSLTPAVAVPEELEAVAEPIAEKLHIAEHPLAGQAVMDFASPDIAFQPAPAVAKAALEGGGGLPSLSQQNRLLRIHGLPMDCKLSIAAIVGNAAMSDVFEFHLDLQSPRDDIDLKDVMGRNVTVAIAMQDGSEHPINGYVESFSFRHTDGNMSMYDARIVAWFGMLNKRINSRIYQEMTVRDVLDTLFKENYPGFADYSFRLHKDYQKESFIVQYGESDQHFAARVMERFGLFYYFEHRPDGHTMVIVDDSTNAGCCPPQDAHARIRFNGGDRVEFEDCITHFSASRELQPTKISLNTFDFKAPHTPQYLEEPTIAEQGAVPRLEVYDGNPAFGYRGVGDGEREARLRMEACEWQAKQFTGNAECRGLIAGRTFEILEHPWFDTAGGDNQFLVLSTHVEAYSNIRNGQPHLVFQNSFSAIRRKIPFRPLRQHERPVMKGPQTATVVGPKGHPFQGLPTRAFLSTRAVETWARASLPST